MAWNAVRENSKDSDTEMFWPGARGVQWRQKGKGKENGEMKRHAVVLQQCVM